MDTLTITFRPGTLADLPQVRELCKDVWGGHDYLPYVWQDWLQNPADQIYVLEKAGSLAGLYCLSRQNGAGWIKGVRVATAFKRQGLAAQMLEHAISQSRAQNLTPLRYGTNDTNIPMHILADRYDFKLVAIYSYILAPLVQSGEDASPMNSASRLVQAQELEAAWNFITTAPSWRSGDKLHCVRWNWKALEKDEVAAQISAQQVFGYFEQANLTALAIAYPDQDNGSLFVSWLDGSPDAMLKLVRFMQQITTQNMADHDYADTTETALEIMIVRDEVRDQKWREAGLQINPDDYMRVFQRS